MGQKLSFDQTKELLIRNGANPLWVPLMAGIAATESGLYTDKLNPVAPDFSVGLWQINYFKGVDPRNGAYVDLLGPRTSLYGSPDELLGNTDKQAKAAIALWGPGTSGSWNWNGNKVITQWQQEGTFLPPDDAKVREWVTAAGFGSALDTTGTAGSMTGGGGSGGAIEGATTISEPVDGDGIRCSRKNKKSNGSFTGGGVSIFGSGDIGGACQLKALAGGLVVGMGLTLFITGAVLIAMQTGVGKKAAGTVSGFLPGQGLIKSFGGSRAQFPRVTAETRFESAANYDARNPSVERQAATRKARSGTLGAQSFSMDDLADMF